VAVALPLEGSYGQLVGFLREVERSPRFLTVDRVSMRAEQAGAAALQVELSTYLRQSPGGRREGRRGRS
jgi:Tfp pilus assembly protein PilO